MNLLDLLDAGSPPLTEVLARIVESPHRAVVTARRLGDAGDGVGVDADDLVATASEAGAIARAADGEDPDLVWRGERYRFVRVVQRVRGTSVDTHPNRFVRHFAVRCRAALRHLPASERRDRAIARLDRVLSAFHELSPLSVGSTDHPVLVFHPLYRRVVEASLALGAYSSSPTSPRA